MKLSELIRLGAMNGNQAFGTYRTGDDTCAIGAAAMAAGIRVGDPSFVKFEDQFEPIFKQPCPACGAVPDSDNAFRSGFINVVLHLNDLHKWTREQIADWVELIERSQEQCSLPTPAQESDAVACHACLKAHSLNGV